MPSTISPNMGLIVPTVGQEPGPTWATDLNASLGTIDQHNHSSGQGVKISPLGMDINIDLNIQNNNLTHLKTINFTSQGSSFAGVSPNLGCIYVAGNELYYNDESGNVVAITNNGSVNAGAGSITGLPSGTASASYSSGSQTFIWQSATSTPANMDGGSVTIREVVANAKGVKLNSPSSLAADYSLFFPAALPSSQKISTIDSSGNIAANYVVDNSTIEIVSNTIRVKDAGITTAKLADASVTKPKLSAANIIQSPSPGGTQFTSSTSFLTLNNLSVTITTSGRPVVLWVQADQSGNNFFFKCFANATPLTRYYRDSSVVVGETGFLGINGNTPSGDWGIPLSFYTIDMPSAGTHTYEFQLANVAGQTAGFQNAQLVAMEL